MLEKIKQILPSIVFGIAFGWIFYLHGEISDLRDINSQLQDSMHAYNGLITEWYNESQRFCERRTEINEALSANSSPEWDAAELPASYLRVLEEAGIYNATGSADARGTGSQTDGHD